MRHDIADYALVGDCRSAALVARDGSIDWWCPSRFDGPACFSALLGDPEHGHFKIGPVRPDIATSRAYDGESLVLTTTYVGDGGVVSVTDAMLLGQPRSTLVREIRGLSGAMEMAVSLVPAFDYGRSKPWVTVQPNDVTVISGPEGLSIHSSVPLSWTRHRGDARFDVQAGDVVHFLVRDIDPFAPNAAMNGLDLCQAVDQTRQGWRQWIADCTYRGPYREAVIRSLLVLKALTYAPTGGIVASPTTSLPEQPGGRRNWDYRYCWLRDAAVTVLALLATGMRAEAEAWLGWLLTAAAGEPEDLQIMYGVRGERRLPEVELDWLPGFGGARPVRVGNAAASQLQLDVYGEVVSAVFEAARAGVRITDDIWDLHCALLTHLERVWRTPDDGMWEVRGGARQFLHSKVMAWVAFDRALRGSALLGRSVPTARWSRVRDTIRDELCANGFDEQLGSFVQFYGARHVDATALLLPLLGVLPPDDKRVLSTTRVIEDSLLDGDLVHRYRPREAVEGVEGGEGAFVACSFWLSANYAQRGDDALAVALFESLLARTNDVGLLSEEIDPATGKMLGNYPQAYSHLAMILAAHQIGEGRIKAADVA